MATYLEAKNRFYAALLSWIEKSNQKEIPMFTLELKAQDEYGFGRSMILKLLSPVFRSGVLSFNEKNDTISKNSSLASVGYQEKEKKELE